jgi:hypothetical protein
MEGRARGDVNVIDGGIEERETHNLEGDVTKSRGAVATEDVVTPHAFSAFACSWSWGLGAPVHVWILRTVHI